jgi:branched-subunit amino acid aminotransferase/4-amino-4-deoxychorismate lyase
MATEVSTADLACLDGRIEPAAEAQIPATDEGLLRGNGVFEVIRVYGGRPFALGDHLDRIERSAGNLRLGYEVPRAALEGEAAELLEARGGERFDGLLRIVLTVGGRRLLLTEPLPGYPERIRLGFVTYAPTRVLDGIKSLSYASNMLSTRLAQERGFDEALLVTPHGRVLEGPTSSFFWADREGELWTPPLEDHLLASITRDRVIRLVGARERACTTDDALEASEAFLASTTREVQSVAVIEEREFPETGERTAQAAAAFRAHVEESLR